MTIKEVSSHFHRELSSYYPVSEIESFRGIIFNALMEYDRSALYLNTGERVPHKMLLQIYDIIEQLKRNRPIQYILGSTEFYGMSFIVDHSVLIPRPETEELVKWALDDNRKVSPRIIDIGSGSGCIAIALAKMLPSAEVYGIDVSEGALAIAKKNAALHNVSVDFRNADILSPSVSDFGLFDIVISNPPYIPHRQMARMQPNVLDYEPHLALFVPDDDPQLFYKAITRFAQNALNKDGYLYLEVSETEAFHTRDVIGQAGFLPEVRKDINDKYRMIKAFWP